MKLFRFATFGAVCALLSGAVFAQKAPPAAVENAVCQLSGKCAPDSSTTDDEKDGIVVGQERSFSLMKPGTTHQGADLANTTPARRPPVGKDRTAHRRHLPVGTADMLLNFPLGSAELTPAAATQVQVFAEALNASELAGARFVVDGHTDSIGTREANLELSQRRAQAVVDYLVNRGIAPNRLIAHGYGFDRPREGRSASDPANRRVEIVKVN